MKNEIQLTKQESEFLAKVIAQGKKVESIEKSPVRFRVRWSGWYSGTGSDSIIYDMKADFAETVQNVREAQKRLAKF